MIASLWLTFALVGQAPATARSLPSSVTIARHSYFDFGPPFDHYDIASIRATESGVEIERFKLEPEGLQCINPPTMQTGRVEVPRSLAEILQNQNPCAMPLKELRRKEKKPKGPHFSGALLALRLQCGDGIRTFQISAWDSDLFEPDSKIAPRTAWIRSVFEIVDKEGPELEEIQLFKVPTDRIVSREVRSPMEEMLRKGLFDGMLAKAPHALSAIYAESQRTWPAPTAVLKSATLFLPDGDVPLYPDIARAARLQGTVTISATVLRDGTMTDVRVTGPPLLVTAARARVSKWIFDAGAAERGFEGVIEYDLNCAGK